MLFTSCDVGQRFHLKLNWSGAGLRRVVWPGVYRTAWGLSRP
jgi:hypothetical protein